MAKKTDKSTDTVEEKPLVFDIELNDTTLSGIIKRRFNEAKSHWNKKYDLDNVRDQNKQLYNSEYVQKKLRDQRYEDIFSDNKLFTSIRTIVPFVTSNMTKPEITPANDGSLNLQFADDFEKILVEEAADSYGRDKVKLAIQDLMAGSRVGVLKWVYDPDKKKLCLEHLDPASVVIGNRARLRDEPDVQHTQEKSIGDLIKMFPDKKDMILKEHNIIKAVPSQLEELVKITENWVWIVEEDKTKLAIVWMTAGNKVLGKMSDPNWIDDGQNVINEHMSPFVFFNFLNDGSGYIDETSFIEMAQYNQKQYDKRGATIADNAAYAGIGVPVFGKGAIKEETAAKVAFNPKQRLLLDSEDVSKSFTTWNGGTLQPFVLEDKQDMKQSVLDVFGTNQVQSGAGSENKTLGQDVISRNQAEGRQQEIIDCVDNGMLRFYQLEAQMIYRYFDEVQYYNFLGDDGKFEHLAISQKRIAENIGIKIRIKAGSSIPVDRSQKIAQTMKLLEFKRIGTLRAYKELGVEDPEEAYKEYLREMINPQGDLTEMDKEIYSREADEDLQLVIGGKKPDDREDITPEYIAHLNEYLLTNQYELLPTSAQQRVNVYVAEVIAQAQRKMLKQEMQMPLAPPAMPVDPNDPNAQQDPNAIMPPAAAASGAPDPNAMPPAAPPAMPPM